MLRVQEGGWETSAEEQPTHGWSLWDTTAAAYERQGNGAEASSALEKALELRLGADEIDEALVYEIQQIAAKLVGSLNKLGVIEFQQGDMSVAENYLRRADDWTSGRHGIELFANPKDRIQMRATTFNNIGCMYKRQNQLQKAYKSLQKAVRLEDSVGGPTASTVANLCAILTSLGRNDEAVQYARMAIDQLTPLCNSAPNVPLSAELQRNRHLLVVSWHNLAGALHRCTDTASKGKVWEAFHSATSLAQSYLGSQHPTTVAVETSYQDAKRLAGQSKGRITSASKRPTVLPKIDPKNLRNVTPRTEVLAPRPPSHKLVKSKPIGTPLAGPYGPSPSEIASRAAQRVLANMGGKSKASSAPRHYHYPAATTAAAAPYQAAPLSSRPLVDQKLPPPPELMPLPFYPMEISSGDFAEAQEADEEPTPRYQPELPVVMELSYENFAAAPEDEDMNTDAGLLNTYVNELFAATSTRPYENQYENHDESQFCFISAPPTLERPPWLPSYPRLRAPPVLPPTNTKRASVLYAPPDVAIWGQAELEGAQVLKQKRAADVAALKQAKLQAARQREDNVNQDMQIRELPTSEQPQEEGVGEPPTLAEVFGEAPTTLAEALALYRSGSISFSAVTLHAEVTHTPTPPPVQEGTRRTLHRRKSLALHEVEDHHKIMTFGDIKRELTAASAKRIALPQDNHASPSLGSPRLAAPSSLTMVTTRERHRLKYKDQLRYRERLIQIQKQEERLRRHQLEAGTDESSASDSNAVAAVKAKNNKRFKAAIVIQKAFRGYLARASVEVRKRKLKEMERRFRSARAIQKIGRSWLNRTSGARAVLRRLGASNRVGHIYTAVCSIQRFWRRTSAKLVGFGRKQALAKGRNAKLYIERRRWGATVIQSFVRAVRARRLARAVRQTRRQHAAYVIQRVWRMVVPKCREYRRAKEELRRQWWAAAKMQAGWRAYQTRIWYACQKLSKKLRTIRKGESDAATKIQTAFRGHQGREKFEARKVEMEMQRQHQQVVAETRQIQRQAVTQQKVQHLETKKEVAVDAYRKEKVLEAEQTREYDRQLYLEGIDREAAQRLAAFYDGPVSDYTLAKRKEDAQRIQHQAVAEVEKAVVTIQNFAKKSTPANSGSVCSSVADRAAQQQQWRDQPVDSIGGLKPQPQRVLDREERALKKLEEQEVERRIRRRQQHESIAFRSPLDSLDNTSDTSEESRFKVDTSRGPVPAKSHLEREQLELFEAEERNLVKHRNQLMGGPPPPLR